MAPPGVIGHPHPGMCSVAPTPTRAQAWRGLVAVTCLVVSAASASAAVDRWWTTPDIQAKLQLKAAQVSALNRIFNETLSDRLASGAKLAKLEQDLARLMARPDAGEAETLRLVEDVEGLRASRNVARTMMLVRMLRVLSPAQRRTLKLLGPPALPSR